MSDQLLTCHGCNAVLPTGYSFCIECGHESPAPEASPRTFESELVHRKEAIARILLWSLVPALTGIVGVYLYMVWEWASPGAESFHDPGPWVNAALGVYCWVALWLGIILRADHRWQQVSGALFLLSGLAGAVGLVWQELG